jgi:hypothetical protein
MVAMGSEERDLTLKQRGWASLADDEWLMVGSALAGAASLKCRRNVSYACPAWLFLARGEAVTHREVTRTGVAG